MYFAAVSIPYYELRNDTYTCVVVYAYTFAAGVRSNTPGVAAAIMSYVIAWLAMRVDIAAMLYGFGGVTCDLENSFWR